MEKKHNKYRITLEHLHSPKDLGLNETIDFEFENHDEIFLSLKESEKTIRLTMKTKLWNLLLV